jgi:hypothetical protein
VIAQGGAQQGGGTRGRVEAVRRIEIERQPVRLVELIGPAVHHVHRDAAQVHERQQRLAGAPDDVVDVPANGRSGNTDRRHAGGQIVRRLLLKKALAAQAFGAPLHRDGAGLHPWQDVRRDACVELRQIELRQPLVRPEHLSRVRQRHAADRHGTHGFKPRVLASHAFGSLPFPSAIVSPTARGLDPKACTKCVFFRSRPSRRQGTALNNRSSQTEGGMV